LGGLLEHLLKISTPDGRQLRFVQLLKANEHRLPNFDQLRFARETRNDIVHGDRVSERAILQAEAEFQFAVEQVLPSFAADIRQDVLGERRPAVTPPRPAQPAPERVFVPPLTTVSPPSVQRPSPGIWFTLAGAFLLVAVFAYLVRPQRVEQQQSGPAVQAAPQAPPVVATLRPPEPAAPSRQSQAVPVTAQPPRPTREEEFGRLVNTNLSLSSTQPNVAVLITSSGPGASVADALQGLLSDARTRLIFNLADLNALRAGGFFDEMYAGNGQLLSQATRLSGVDYILLGKALYAFRPQPGLDPDLLTCDLTLACRLVDRAGTAVQSASFTVAGPGFTQAQALERAAENAARQLKEKVLDTVR
jgi:hypothetical protein